MLSSVLVGLSSGAAALILKTSVHYIHLLLSTHYVSLLNNLIYLLAPLFGILITSLIVRYVFKRKLGRGISNILYEIAQKSSFVAKDKIYSHILTSSITVGFGGSAGLESPIVVTGSAIGSNFGRIYILTYKERTVLLAAGAAAGIAAVFNAPIAGVMFALEILLPEIIATEMIAVIIAAVSGALMSKIILREDILFFFQLQEHFDFHNLPFYIGLGIILGFISLYYSKTTLKIEGLLGKYKPQVVKRALIGGTIVGVLSFLFPPLFGEGYSSIKLLANGNPEALLNDSIFESMNGNEFFLLFFIGLIMMIKVFATSFTLSAGGNGGNFAPTLFVGAFAGFLYSKLWNLINGITLPISNFTLVGMSGVLSGVMHAPLTAIFLIAEITGGYELMIPLMIVSSLSFVISRHFEPYSMDTKKLAQKGLIFTENKDQNILTQIKISNLIDTDVLTLHPENRLGKLVYLVRNNNKSIFAIVAANGDFKGVVTLDRIRDMMFNEALYEKTTMKDIMKIPRKVINIEDNMQTVLRKFDQCNEWTLPVIEGKRFVGFISKSKIHVEYRAQLIEQTGVYE